jgi:hypothetical protein
MGNIRSIDQKSWSLEMKKERLQDSTPEHATTAITAAQLLHPATHFDHPCDVLAADHISNDEKRAILASWATDMSAIDSMPAWRQDPGMDQIVSYDEIIAALKALDGDGQCSPAERSSASTNVNKANRRRIRRHQFGGFGLCSYRKGGRRRQLFET